MNETLSKFLDAARWVAALCVLIAHLNDRTFTVLANIPPDARSYGLYLWVFLYGFAHQAVVIFFVLSGFLVGGSALSRAREGTLDLSRYCLDRTVRIYVVLVPALALTTLLDAVGASFFGGGIYGLERSAGHFAPWALPLNLFELQDIFVPYWGTNGALWTLSHEYWNYLTFPLLCLPLMTKIAPWGRLAGFLAGLALLFATSISGSWHLFGFALWAIGAVAVLPNRPLLRSKNAALGVFLAVSIGCRLAFRFADLEASVLGNLVDLAVTLSFANLLLTLRFAERGWRVLDWGGHSTLANFSYSLYAIHLPLITLLCCWAQRQWGVGWRGVPATGLHWLVGGAIFTIAVLAAWGFSRITEAKTPVARRCAYQLLAAAKRRTAIPSARPAAST
jgi:peptidoglycan/LPS O-acetylase OafA/YrhL